MNRPSSISLRQGGHQPLLWWVLPCLAGVFSAYAWGAFIVGPWLWGAAAASALIAGVAALGSWTRLWQVSYSMGVFLLSAFCFQQRCPQAPQGAHASRDVIVILEISKVFQQTNSYGRTTCIAQIQSAQGPQVFKGRRVYVSFAQRTCIPGEQLWVRGVLEPLGSGEGFADYLSSMGVHERLRCAQVLEVYQPAPAPERWRQSLTHAWEAHLQRTWACERYAPLYASMVLGHKALIDSELKERLGLSGCLHLFAVSGLHVGILAGLLLWPLRRLPLGLLLTSVLLLGYVWLTGLAASALRAVLMLLLLWMARGLSRRPQALAALLTSVFVAFWLSPRSLLGAGFQLSHIVVASFLLVGAPWGHSLQRRLSFMPRWLKAPSRWLTSSLALSTAATLYSTPVLLLHFQKASFVSLLVNLFAVPLGSLTLLLAWCSSLCAPLGLSPFFNTLGCCLLSCLDWALVVLSAPTRVLSVQTPLGPLSCCALLMLLFGASRWFIPRQEARACAR